MKIKIGPYKNWYGPYQLAETLCWWAKDCPDEYGFPSRPRWVSNFGEWLAYGKIAPPPESGDLIDRHETRSPTLLHRFLLWIDSLRTRQIEIKIDSYDTWNMDSTLALIITPMLVQLKEQKHGSPLVADEDVPERLKSNKSLEEGEVDELYHKRWEWVLDEMIWAFKTSQTDWQDQFRQGEHDYRLSKLETGELKLVRGPNHTFQIDEERIHEYQQRIDNGFRLFGRYYQSLWS